VDLTGTGADGDTDALRVATAVAGAVTAARDLVNTPPNDLYPETFAARARALAEAAGVTVEVLDDAALAEGGFGGVLGVGQGSSRTPRLVRLSYAGRSAPRRRVALVGKGITFDTGGISIKPAAGMEQMTSDMAGRRPSSRRPCSRAPGAAGGRDGHGARWPRTCRPTPPTGPVTCCGCTAGGPSRSSTPTPRAG
jgi:hypothetical protein